MVGAECVFVFLAGLIMVYIWKADGGTLSDAVELGMHIFPVPEADPEYYSETCSICEC